MGWKMICAVLLLASNVLALTPQEERDEIFMLGAYAYVYADWQTPEDKPGRGHNIGSILVDPDGVPVHAARNCNYEHRNSTHHGEVRLITQYLEGSHKMTLRGYTVYTTLEPCAMCSGMMTLTEVNRTVYGQTDPDYGAALERLQFDASRVGGYGPYPRPVISERIVSRWQTDLDMAYRREYEKKVGLTNWLRSPEAKAIFADAAAELEHYKVEHFSNTDALWKTRALIAPPKASAR